MTLAYQKTLKSAISCSGTGLHSGDHVAMTIRPAPEGSGIVFRRTDPAGNGVEIPADWKHVVNGRLCTMLGDGNGVNIGTVEHLMAALAGCEVDNALVEVNGNEVPIMDGSAEPFVFLVECAGVAEQTAPRKAIEILKRVAVGDQERSASLTPGAGFSIAFEIEFDSEAITEKSCFVTLGNGAFKSEICRARTFGFDHEVVELRANGLAQGGSLDNAVVVSGDRVLNDEGLRYDDEFVRHKVLDCIGDLYLAGAPIVGHFHGFRSGHSLNHALLQALFSDPTAWRLVDAEAYVGGGGIHGPAAAESLAQTA